jgi:hypothetical protein
VHRRNKTRLFNHQLRLHVFMVGPANNPANDLILAFGRIFQRDYRRLPGTDGLLDAQARHIKTMLDVGSGNL